VEVISDKIRKGVILTNMETLTRGVVIDWGLKNIKHRSYLPIPSYDKGADAVRVRTSRGVEVWPINAVTDK
jgi:hypothetical protein